MRRLILLIICLSSVLCAQSFAEENDSIFNDQLSSIGGKELERAVPESARELIGKEHVSPDISLEKGIVSIIKKGGEEGSRSLKTAIKSMFAIFAACAICAVASSMQNGSRSSTLSGGSSSISAMVTGCVGALVIFAVTVGDMEGLLTQCSNAIYDVDAFSKTLLPTVAAAGAISGAPASGSANCVATMFFSDIVITVITKIILPLVHVYIGMSVVGAAVPNKLPQKISSFIRWGSVGFLKIALTLFIAYISVSGAIAGNADAVAAKTAKFAISGAVPVVGGIVSDAAETVLAGAGILKNAVGIFGMLIIVSICYIPFIRLGIYYLSYKAAAALTSSICPDGLVKAIDGMGDGIGIAIGMLGTAATLIFISMICAVVFMRAQL